MGKIFDAITKKGDPLADQVLNPAKPVLTTGEGPAPAQIPNAAAAVIRKGAPAQSKEALLDDSRPAPAEHTVITRLPEELDVPLLKSMDPTVPEASPANGRAAAPGNRVAARTLPIHVPQGLPLLPFDSGPSRASEQYRYLRTKIVQHVKAPRVVLVSSPGPSDGKSVTAANLTGALSLKSSGAVVLVDADLRRAAQHGQLGIPKSPGLVDILRGNCAVEDALVCVEQFPNLFVIPAGESKQNPAELLDSTNWAAVITKLKAMFKYVVVDSPPVASVADYHLIEVNCDAVVLVLRPDHTSRSLTTQALEIVPKEKLLGVVVNCVSDWFLPKHGYYNYAYDYLTLESAGKGSKR